MFAAKVTVCVAAPRSGFRRCQRTVRHVNITTIQNKHLIFVFNGGLCRRPAAGQRVTDLERSSWLIRKQTGCRSQKTETQTAKHFCPSLSHRVHHRVRWTEKLRIMCRTLAELTRRPKCLRMCQRKRFTKFLMFILTQQLTKLDDF